MQMTLTKVNVHLRRPATAGCVMCCGRGGVVVVVVRAAVRVRCWVVMVMSVQESVVIDGAWEA